MNKKPRPAPDAITGHWGIFGGMFDPVHLGHVTVAEDLCAAEHLVGLMLIPGLRPPHRTEVPRASFSQRCAMLRLAFVNKLDVIISDIEQTMSTPAFTIDIVRELKREYSQAQFSFLMGADQLEKFATWHQPDEILKEVRVVAGTRPGFSNLRDNPYAGGIKFVATRPIDVSSTQIRDAVRAGWTVSELSTLVPPLVAEYIVKNRLYQ